MVNKTLITTKNLLPEMELATETSLAKIRFELIKKNDKK